MRVLPTFRGYTLDVRLRQFRKVTWKPAPKLEFVEFNSPKGQRLLEAYRRAGEAVLPNDP